ncbi:MAG: heavy-metal-associated domain-containing protein [Pseudomonadota bacterium]
MKSILVAALAALVFTINAYAAEPVRTIEMNVDGLVCAFCAQGIEKKLRKQAATDDVFVSLETKLVAVALKPDQDIADATLKSLLTEAGYTIKEIKRSETPLATFRAAAQKP